MNNFHVADARLVAIGKLTRKTEPGARRRRDAELPPVCRPARVARMLALAHHLQQAIDRGIVADRAAVARALGLTRARVTQLLDLLLLAPEVQEQVLALEAVSGVEPMTERELRRVVHAGPWVKQRGQWRHSTPQAAARGKA